MWLVAFISHSTSGVIFTGLLTAFRLLILLSSPLRPYGQQRCGGRDRIQVLTTRCIIESGMWLTADDTLGRCPAGELCFLLIRTRDQKTLLRWPFNLKAISLLIPLNLRLLPHLLDICGLHCGWLERIIETFLGSIYGAEHSLRGWQWDLGGHLIELLSGRLVVGGLCV